MTNDIKSGSKDAAIIIPVFNRKQTTLSCLNSVLKFLPANYIIIVCDAGSTDGTQAAVREQFPDVFIVEGNSMDWWAASTNLGVKIAIERGCKYILTFNDDNQVENAVFARLVSTAKACPDSIISAVVCYLDEPGKIFFAGRRRSTLTDRFIYMDHNKTVSTLKGGIREVDLLHGMCTLFPASVFQSTGYFDDRVFPHLFADDDLVLRAKANGYRLLVDLDAVVLNDHTKKGLTPYDRRLVPGEILDLLISRRSAFQVSTRCIFFWRHRRSVVAFMLTIVFDYIRLAGAVVMRWLLPAGLYSKVEQFLVKLMSA